MKVKIGPYINWIGPYQIANAVFLWPDKYTEPETWRQRSAEQLGKWLSGTWVAGACQWIQDHRKRQVSVHIDRYDAWGAANTLSLIALPLLMELKLRKRGAPCVEDCDVPERLRSTSAPAKENAWDTDANHFDRWEYVLDEMIWAHQQEVNDDPAEADCWQHNLPDANWPFPNTGSALDNMLDRIECYWNRLAVVQARKANGFRLFGKYYQALWD